MVWQLSWSKRGCSLNFLRYFMIVLKLQYLYICFMSQQVNQKIQSCWTNIRKPKNRRRYVIRSMLWRHQRFWFTITSGKFGTAGNRKSGHIFAYLIEKLENYNFLEFCLPLLTLLKLWRKVVLELLLEETRTTIVQSKITQAHWPKQLFFVGILILNTFSQ